MFQFEISTQKRWNNNKLINLTQWPQLNVALMKFYSNWCMKYLNCSFSIWDQRPVIPTLVSFKWLLLFEKEKKTNSSNGTQINEHKHILHLSYFFTLSFIFVGCKKKCFKWKFHFSIKKNENWKMKIFENKVI